MTSFAKIFDNLKLAIYKRYSDNPAKLLSFAGTLGWALSCTAQVGAIVFNEKLSSKDKKFLIPQEITDGAVNVGLFFGLTMAAHKTVTKMIENGKIMFAEMKKPLQKELAKRNQTLTEALKANDNMISKILTNPKDIQNFTKLKGGTTLGVTLLASVISCNILTPLIRNFIGARWQKRLTDPNNPFNKTSHQEVMQKAELSPTQMPASTLASQPIKKINHSFGYNNPYPISNLKI